MKQGPPPMRLGRTHERCVYFIGLLTFLSGAGWLADHYLLAGVGEFGDAHAAGEPLWLAIHGAAAMAALTVFGSLLPGHIARAWKARRNLGSGLVMLALFSLLIVTGYGLYYVGNEDTRPWISLAHWSTGIAIAGSLVMHIYLGKRRIRGSKSVPAGSIHGGVGATASMAAPARCAIRGESEAPSL